MAAFISPEINPLSSVPGFRVIGNHLCGESLLGGIPLLLGDLGRIDLEHVAHRRFLDEVMRARV